MNGLFDERMYAPITFRDVIDLERSYTERDLRRVVAEFYRNLKCSRVYFLITNADLKSKMIPVKYEYRFVKPETLTDKPSGREYDFKRSSIYPESIYEMYPRSLCIYDEVYNTMKERGYIK